MKLIGLQEGFKESSSSSLAWLERDTRTKKKERKKKRVKYQGFERLLFGGDLWVALGNLDSLWRVLFEDGSNKGK